MDGYLMVVIGGVLPWRRRCRLLVAPLLRRLLFLLLLAPLWTMLRAPSAGVGIALSRLCGGPSHGLAPRLGSRLPSASRCAALVRRSKADVVSLPPIRSMRDINDFCLANEIPSLAQGMIELPPPRRLREVAAEVALEDAVHTYRNRFGELEYREGLSRMLKTMYSLDLSPAQILCTAGVTGGIISALLVFRKRFPKGKVALIEPFYTYHLLQVQATMPEDPVFVGSRPGTLLPDLDELEAKVSAGEVQCVVITNPSNPSGLLWTEEEISRLERLVSEKGLFLISDECYSEMVFEDQHLASPARRCQEEDNIVCCRGFSKCLGAQSWRVGYALASEATIQELMPAMDPVYICVARDQHTLGRYLLNNLEDYQEHITSLNALLRSNWAMLKQAISERFGWVAVEPQGTMYGCFKHDCASDLEAAEVALRAGVGLCPGSLFYRPGTENSGYLRIHCGVARSKAEHIVEVLGAA